jgi:hypothetical protein
LEQTIDANIMPQPYIKKNLKESIPSTFEFLLKNGTKKSFDRKYYEDFSELFDMWREKLYILNDLRGTERTIQN